jgi:hypothetical protein
LALVVDTLCPTWHAQFSDMLKSPNNSICETFRASHITPLSYPSFRSLLITNPQRLTVVQYQRSSPSSTSFLRLRPSIPLPPASNPLINLPSTNPILNQPHHHSQLLRISIPGLVIKEKHLLIFKSCVLMQFLKVADFGTGVDLEVCEEIYRLYALGRSCG